MDTLEEAEMKADFCLTEKSRYYPSCRKTHVYWKNEFRVYYQYDKLEPWGIYKSFKYEKYLSKIVNRL